ncbi:succinylglutamate desuccinylase/aspartoacylase domain-containing protein [Candidatus Halobonum tyrrellensis]|uniref:Succinylglutamate desuccinylase n=1 Tax=Candidatus Halobonum tyrrellensis G22 TaxID=1324957 RepID=V4IVC5_9EURY|nr:succinylglutamate desuccinylase/aspartoacylase family protein [Candidatus Halobonum tyrrellensis]ESP87152.1 succinylglutamate desuccinylase [Candidatus Halobonum tyrrellensis G22]
MRIHQLGEGVPEVAVVGGLHGDEPCGPAAVERLVAADPDVERPVKLIVANEEALERDVRYVDEDLNRAFPGDPDADTHERRLASHIARELEGCTTLSLHSTQSYAEPFALCATVDAVARAVVPSLPTNLLIETDPFTEGRLIEHPHTLEVECGLQGSDRAAENAYWLSRAFLAATGALAAPVADDATPFDVDTTSEVGVFELLSPIAKPAAETYEVFARNFERVEAGERFASADGETLTAEEPFYPVLMSAYGYADLFGYAAEKVGTLD